MLANDSLVLRATTELQTSIRYFDLGTLKKQSDDIFHTPTQPVAVCSYGASIMYKDIFLQRRSRLVYSSQYTKASSCGVQLLFYRAWQ